MQKICPKSGHELMPIARGAYKCPGCSGVFLPSGLVPVFNDESASAATGEHDAQAGSCPVDRSILSRAEIEVGDERPPIHLERCSSCRGIWFDAGEWSLLADQQLLENLDQIWTTEWRSRQRRQRNEREYEQRLLNQFGPELFKELQAVAAKLKGHERRSQALAFIREASDN